MRKLYALKKTLAGLIAILVVAGAMPSNVGGLLKGENGIVANAAGMPGAHSYTDSAGNVFLGGNYIEVGVAKAGSFGTTNAVPSGQNWHQNDGNNRLGLVVDNDGFDVGGDPTTNDFFIPGTEEERFIVAYTQNGTAIENHSAAITGGYWSSPQQELTTVDKSDLSKGILKAVTTGVTKEGVKLEQTIEFGVNDKFFKITAKVTNNSGSTLQNVRYMRSVDPDQDAILYSSAYSTYNKVICNPRSDVPYTDDQCALVVARGQETLEGFFYASFDPYARACILPGLRGNAYGNDYAGDPVWRDRTDIPTTPSDSSIELTRAMVNADNINGYYYKDTGVAMTFDWGTLANGESRTGSIIVSLDANVQESLNNVISNVISSAVCDINLPYNGTTQNLPVSEVEVKDNSGNPLRYGTDYELTGTTSAKDAGKYNFSVHYKGDYAGQEDTPLKWEITKAELEVRANDNTVLKGTAPADVPNGVTYSGFVGSDNESVLEGTLAYDLGTYTASSNAGGYPITPKGLTSNNYKITFLAGGLTVVNSSYYVRFNANGGTGTMPNQHIVSGTTTPLTANAFTKTGHDFVGWATSADGAKVYNNGGNVRDLTSENNGIVDLYAVWKPAHYILNYNANGGSISTASKDVVYNQAIGTLDTPSRTGYAFAGWFTAADGGTQVTADTVYNNTDNSTIYAHWTPKIYNISFDDTVNREFTLTDLTTNTAVTDGKLTYSHRYQLTSPQLLDFGSFEDYTIRKKSAEGMYYYTFDCPADNVSVSHEHVYKFVTSADKTTLLATCQNEFTAEQFNFAWLNITDNIIYGDEYDVNVVANPELSGIVIEDQEVKYSAADATSNAAEKPVDAGSYFATAGVKIDGTMYYFTRTFEIAQKNINQCAVIITPDDVTYSGEEVIPEVKVKDGEKILVEGRDYTCTIVPHTGVGDWNITVNGIGNYTGTKSATWSINKALMTDLTWDKEDTSFVYDGEAKPFAITNAPENTEIVYEYFKGDVSLGTTAPTEVGNYTVKAYLTNENYNDAEETWNYAITKRQVTLIPDELSKTYGDADPDITFEADNLVYSEDKELFSEALAFASSYHGAAGAYDIVLADPATLYDNYTVVISDNEGKLIVNKKALTADMFSYTGATSFTYNGHAQGVSVAGADGTLMNASDYVVGDTTSATNAGNYSVTVTASENGNYSGSVTLENEWQINPLAIEAAGIVLSQGNFIYDGNLHDAEISYVRDIYGTVLVEGVDYTYESESGKRAGTYNVEINGIGNYCGTPSVNWTISKAPNTATLSVTDKVYDGEAIVPVVTTPETCTVRYTYKDADNNVLAGAPVDVGTYTVEVYVPETANYNEQTLSMKFSITKRNVVISAANKEITYGTAKDEDIDFAYDANGQIAADEELFQRNILTALGYNDDLGVVKSYDIVLDFDYINTADIDEDGLNDFRNYSFTYADTNPTLTVKPVNLSLIDIYLNDDYGSGLVYNGLYQNISNYITVEYADNVWGTNPELGVDYRVIGNINKKNIGTYTAYVDANPNTAVVLSGNYTGRVSKSWSIVSIDYNETEYVVDNITYGDELDYTFPVESLGIDESVEPNISYQFYKGVGEEKEEIEEAPTDAGIYTVVATVTAENYNTNSYTATFTIAPKGITATAGNTSITYGEEDPSVIPVTLNGVIDGDEVEFTNEIAVVAYEGDGFRPVNAGGYGYTGNVTSLNPNYTITDTILTSGKLTVNKKELDDSIVGLRDGSDAYVLANEFDTKTVSVIGNYLGQELVEGVDYELSEDTEACEVGDFIVTITGIGNFSGEVSIPWRIVEHVNAEFEIYRPKTVRRIDSNGEYKKRLTCEFAVTDVPEGYELVETGFIYSNALDAPTDLSMYTNEHVDGTIIKKGTNSTHDLTIADIRDNDNGIIAVGYAKLRDADGFTVYSYSDNVGGSYDEIRTIEAYEAISFEEGDTAAVVDVKDPADPKRRVTVEFTADTNDNSFQLAEFEMIYSNDEGASEDINDYRVEKNGTNGVKVGRNLNIADILDKGNGVNVVGAVKVTDITGFECYVYNNEFYGGNYVELRTIAAQKAISFEKGEIAAVIDRKDTANLKRRVTVEYSAENNDNTFEIAEYNLLYSNEATASTDISDYTVEKVGTNGVKRGRNLQIADILDKGNGVNAVGAVKVTDATGFECYVYSKEFYGGNYIDLRTEAAQRAISFTMGQPAAVIDMKDADNIKKRVTVSYTAETNDRSFEIAEYNLLYSNEATASTDISDYTVEKVGTNGVKRGRNLQIADILDKNYGVNAVGAVKVTDATGFECYVSGSELYQYKYAELRAIDAKNAVEFITAEATPKLVSGKTRLTVSFTPNITNSAFTITEYGLLYGNSEAAVAEDISMYTIENAGNNGIKRGNNLYVADILDSGYGVKAVGYIKLVDESGFESYVYTDNIGGYYYVS